MTFYWWSHWFWITLLIVQLLSSFAYSLPTPEIPLEYNHQNIKTTTKLHQSTTIDQWPATVSAALANFPRALAENPIALAQMINNREILIMKRAYANAYKNTDKELEDVELNEEEEEEEEEKEVEQLKKVEQLNKMEQLKQVEQEELTGEEMERERIEYEGVEEETADLQQEAELGEFKRSVENSNATNAQEKADKETETEIETETETKTKTETEAEDATVVDAQDDTTAVVQKKTNADVLGIVKLKRDEVEVNNYTNFSSISIAKQEPSTNGSNTINNTNNNNNTNNHNNTNNKKNASIAESVNSTATGTTANKTTNSNDNLHWLHAMIQQPRQPRVSDNKQNNDDDDVDGANDDAIELATSSHRVPFTLENVNKEEELRRAENEHRSRKSKVLSAEYTHINRYFNHSADQKSVLTRSASTAPYDIDSDAGGNISSEPLSSQSADYLNASAIIAICFTVFGACCTVGTIGIMLYRRRYLNKPQTLSEPDSSVYIDDSTMRDNSDEMYSLDNDSFLNSLEAMTIQNYWTDTVKHTKL